MIESPSEFATKKKLKKVKKKSQLEKEIVSIELNSKKYLAERSKYKKDFDKFVKDRQKKWPMKCYIAFGLTIIGGFLAQVMGEAGGIFLLFLFIPALAVLFHMALFEYYRGNVQWTLYVWGALVLVWIGGVGLIIMWFFSSSDTQRLNSYIEERKNR